MGFRMQAVGPDPGPILVAEQSLPCSLHCFMSRKNPGTAYALWCFSLIGLCGVQRMYAGQTGLGIAYLLTLGFCGIGQIIDLFLIPGFIADQNRRSAGSIAPEQQIVVHVNGVPSAASAGADPGSSPMSDEQLLLHACQNQPLSIGAICIETALPSARVKELAESLASQGILRQRINAEGVITYEVI